MTSSPGGRPEPGAPEGGAEPAAPGPGASGPAAPGSAVPGSAAPGDGPEAVGAGPESVEAGPESVGTGLGSADRLGVVGRLDGRSLDALPATGPPRSTITCATRTPCCDRTIASARSRSPADRTCTVASRPSNSTCAPLIPAAERARVDRSVSWLCTAFRLGRAWTTPRVARPTVATVTGRASWRPRECPTRGLARRLLAARAPDAVAGLLPPSGVVTIAPRRFERPGGG